MRFSIRALLALTFLAVLVMLVWRTARETTRNQEHLTRLQKEIKDLELNVRLNEPALHQAILRSRHEFDSVRELRQRSIEHYESLRQKYSGIETPEAGVLAIRTIPSLQTGAVQPPITFRIWVPEDRAVWLKFGVHQADRSVQSSRESEKADDLLTNSPFEDSGPFELQMPPGDQMLEIGTEPAGEGAVPLTITLNDNVLLRSAFVSSEATGANASYISGRSQINFGKNQPLPWLLTGRMNLGYYTSGEEPILTHAFSLWLSNQSGSFANFPGE